MSDVFSPFFPSACAFICIFFSRSWWTSFSKSQPQQATSCGTCVQGTSVQPGPSWWSCVASVNNRVQIGVLEDLPCYLAYVVELLNRLLNSSASVLASGFLAVLRTCRSPGTCWSSGRSVRRVEAHCHYPRPWVFQAVKIRGSALVLLLGPGAAYIKFYFSSPWVLGGHIGRIKVHRNYFCIPIRLNSNFAGW